MSDFDEEKHRRGTPTNKPVPVIGHDGQPLMPTCASRARKMLARGDAVPRRDRVTKQFYIKLTRPTTDYMQSVAVTVDPGAKVDGFAVGSAKQVFLEVEATVPCDVNKKVKTRAMLRRTRRGRLRRRPARFKNRARKDFLAPSQAAKVAQRQTILRELCRLYPVARVVVEDVKAGSRQKAGARDHKHAAKIRNWNTCFSTVMVGKQRLRRFITETLGVGNVEFRGYHTKFYRDNLDIAKPRNKHAVGAHSCDAYALLCAVFSESSFSTDADGNSAEMVLFAVPRRCVPVVKLTRYRPDRRILSLQQLKPGGIRTPRTGTVAIAGELWKGDRVVGMAKTQPVTGTVTGAYRDKHGVVKAVLVTELIGFKTGKQPTQFRHTKVSLRTVCRLASDRWFRTEQPGVLDTTDNSPTTTRVVFPLSV